MDSGASCAPERGDTALATVGAVYGANDPGGKGCERHERVETRGSIENLSR